MKCCFRLSFFLDFNWPYDIAYNSHGEMIVSERDGHKISIIDNKGKKIRTFGSHGDSPHQMMCPQGIAIFIDDMDNVYISSRHKLQKLLAMVN